LPPILINATMAARYWPNRSPIGATVYVGGESPWQVVGIVGDVKQKDPAAPTPPHVYLPLGTPLPPRASTFVVRSSMTQGSVAAAMRRVMTDIDPDVPAYGVRTMEHVIGSATAGPRFRTTLLVLFAATALLLAMVGIYGVISYTVAQRTREIGIRIAIGATRRDVLRMILGRICRVSGIGILAGCATALLLSHTLESLLFEVRAADPRVFIGVALLLLATSVLAGALPALRASSIEPSRTLQYD
jgi:putative ABC transport system permease protein